MRKIFALFVLACFIAGCAANPKTSGNKEDSPISPDKWLKTIKSSKPETLTGKILDIKTGSFVDIEKLTDELSAVSVVFIGEIHDQMAHHRIQNKVLKSIYDKNKQVVVGMEMFQRPYQKYLDDYTKGKITERDMLKKTEYFTRWGFDWRFYQLMVRFAKDNSLKVVALNVPAEITRKVAQTGLASLTKEEKESTPAEIDTTNEQHRKYIRYIYDTGSQMSQMLQFNNFYEAQCLWEDGMADSIAQYFKSVKGNKEKTQMVIFVGAGHIIYKFGIPQRFARRANLPYRTIVPVEVTEIDKYLKMGIKDLAPADYMWFTKPEEGKKTPTIGVMSSSPGEKGSGLKITEVLPGSPAQKGNLQKDDIITAVDGESIGDLFDLKLILQDKNIGDEIELTILRNNKKLKVKIKL